MHGRQHTAQDGYETALQRAEAEVLEQDTGQARLELGRMYFVDDRFEEAQRQVELAFRMFRDEGAPREAARTAISLASLHISAHGQMAAGSGWIERARVLLERVGPCVEWGYLELAAMACDRTNIDDLLASADRALGIALDFGDADLEAQAMADGGLALVTQGRISEGMARLDAALAAISAGEVSPIVAGICFCSMLSACDRTGDVRRPEEWTAIASAMIRGFGDRPKVLHTHCRVAYGSSTNAASDSTPTSSTCACTCSASTSSASVKGVNAPLIETFDHRLRGRSGPHCRHDARRQRTLPAGEPKRPKGPIKTPSDAARHGLTGRRPLVSGGYKMPSREM